MVFVSLHTLFNYVAATYLIPIAILLQQDNSEAMNQNVERMTAGDEDFEEEGMTHNRNCSCFQSKVIGLK